MSLGSKVRIYREKKRSTGLFKVLSIANTDIIIDTGNRPVIFRNTYVKLYNHQTKESDISYLETANGLVKILVDKPANKEIPMLFDYPKLQRPCRRK